MALVFLHSVNHFLAGFPDAGTGTLPFIGECDPFISGHQRRVADLSVRIGRRLGLSDDRIYSLHLGASIHDLGKVNLPYELLVEPGPLQRAQFELIKEHVKLGYEIIKDVGFPWPVGEIVMQHHERLDGSGYPRGLTTKEIILEARIVAVADVVEAMSSWRPYRQVTPGIACALAEIESQSGRLYEPTAVDACVHVFRNEGYRFPESTWPGAVSRVTVARVLDPPDVPRKEGFGLGTSREIRETFRR